MSKAQRKARAAMDKRAVIGSGEILLSKQDRRNVRDTWNRRTMSPAWAWKKENSHAG